MSKGYTIFLEKMKRNIRHAFARVVARIRLWRFCKKHEADIPTKIPKKEFEILVEKLAATMCETGIFKSKRIKNFKQQYCTNCSYRRETKYGACCVLKDEFLKKIKDCYCGGYTEKEK